MLMIDKTQATQPALAAVCISANQLTDLTTLRNCPNIMIE